MSLVPPPGTTIGLMGGSFNPAHDGHLHVARMSARTLGLDVVWFLVSPQNPLKPASGMEPQAKRLAATRALVKKSGTRNIVVTGIEATLGTTRTIDTLRALKRRYPLVHFVWLMGADNMLQFPRWATIEASDAKLLRHLEAPALVFLEGRTHSASATAIRAAS